MNRRRFLGTSALASAAPLAGQGFDPGSTLDFRYAPLSWQTAICFPDDPHKTLVGERGELRYGHPGQGRPIDHFPVVVEISLAGMEPDEVAWQRLEGPGVPIVHTRIERPEAFVELVAFASEEPGEGRVDNVVFEARPRRRARLPLRPLVRLRTRESVTVTIEAGVSRVRLGASGSPVFMTCSAPLALRDTGAGFTLMGAEGIATPAQPLRVLYRFPQAGQARKAIRAEVEQAGRLLENARAFWRSWKPTRGDVEFRLPARYGEFLMASARNIVQARELRDGRLTFQVGPTVYRGLWVVDGHFLQEAARYLGYAREAREGLASSPVPGGSTGRTRRLRCSRSCAWPNWIRTGAVFAGWRLRFCAAWTFCARCARGRAPKAVRTGATAYWRAAWATADSEASARNSPTRSGRSPACAPWPRRPNSSGWTNWRRRTFYEELRRAFFDAARREMRRHPAGFDYLPMLMREDPQWDEPDERRRPRPQVGQWALSHAIYPGLLYDRNDPIVKGHLALMQACTREDVPIETGWIAHEGLWVYNAAFVAHAYLWAGMADWARLTFHGFLNHASPLYCWREEQPLRGSLVAGYVGDMPHNWASAECILFLRHLLALEDGGTLRLLAGVGDFELAPAEPYAFAATPTRFGPLDLTLEPDGSAWRLNYRREAGPAPAHLELPARLGARLRFSAIEGAKAVPEGSILRVDPEARRFSVIWK